MPSLNPEEFGRYRQLKVTGTAVEDGKYRYFFSVQGYGMAQWRHKSGGLQGFSIVPDRSIRSAGDVPKKLVIRSQEGHFIPIQLYGETSGSLPALKFLSIEPDQFSCKEDVRKLEPGLGELGVASFDTCLK